MPGRRCLPWQLVPRMAGRGEPADVRRAGGLRVQGLPVLFGRCEALRGRRGLDLRNRPGHAAARSRRRRRRAAARGAQRSEELAARVDRRARRPPRRRVADRRRVAHRVGRAGHATSWRPRSPCGPARSPAGSGRRGGSLPRARRMRVTRCRRRTLRRTQGARSAELFTAHHVLGPRASRWRGRVLRVKHQHERTPLTRVLPEPETERDHIRYHRSFDPPPRI